MEEKESKTPKHCLNCQYHETYYTKCTTTFCKHKMGYCCKLQKVTMILAKNGKENPEKLQEIFIRK